MLSRSGWKIVLDIIAQATHLGFNPPDKMVLEEFLDLSVEFVNIIVANHLNYIGVNGLVFLIDILYRFASHKQDLSASAISLELFHQMANHLFIVKAVEDKFLELWYGILVRLKELGCDERMEIRAKVLDTLDDIFRDNANKAPLKVWSYFFFEILPQLIQVSEVNFLISRDDIKGTEITISHNLPTPTFRLKGPFTANSIEYEKEATTLATKTFMKEWEKSMTKLLFTSVKILFSFKQLTEETEIKNEIVKKAWNMIIEIYTRVVKSGTYKIICAVLEAIYEKSLPFKNYINNYLEDIWEVFKGIKIWIEMKYQAERSNKIHIGSKIAPIIIKTLENVFDRNDIFTPKTMLELCDLLNTVILYVDWVVINV